MAGAKIFMRTVCSDTLWASPTGTSYNIDRERTVQEWFHELVK